MAFGETQSVEMTGTKVNRGIAQLRASARFLVTPYDLARTAGGSYFFCTLTMSAKNDLPGSTNV